MSRYVAVLVVLVAGLLAAPSGVLAQQRCQAPQGTSGVDQYCEVIPGSRGDEDVASGGDPSISPETAGTLTAEGTDGEALARALDGDPSAPPAKPKADGDAKNGSARTVVVPDAPSSNPFSAVTQAVDGDTTLGSPFFLTLFGVVLLMLGAAWVGYRRGKAE